MTDGTVFWYTANMISADIRLILPQQAHPRALEIATAAYASTRPVFLLMPGGGVDWRGEWSDVSRMSVRMPANPLAINIVHVSTPEHFKMFSPGAKNLAICTEEIALPEELGEWSVVTVDDRPIDAASFARWLSFVA